MLHVPVFLAVWCACAGQFGFKPKIVEYRLVDGSTPYEGRLEVRIFEVWGTVCSDGFNRQVAIVACRSLGMSMGEEKRDAFFGAGSGPINIDDIECNGDELTLSECNFITDTTVGGATKNNINCNHTSDMGVICQPSKGEKVRPITRKPVRMSLPNISSSVEGSLLPATADEEEMSLDGILGISVSLFVVLAVIASVSWYSWRKEKPLPQQADERPTQSAAQSPATPLSELPRGFTTSKWGGTPSGVTDESTTELESSAISETSSASEDQSE